MLFLIEQVVVVSGETGCGKTTQLPQYILESEIEAARGATCSIICTQPRRISAISVSERVAAERGEKIGESVSYLHLYSEKIFHAEISVLWLLMGTHGYFSHWMLSRIAVCCPSIGC